MDFVHPQYSGRLPGRLLGQARPDRLRHERPAGCAPWSPRKAGDADLNGGTEGVYDKTWVSFLDYPPKYIFVYVYIKSNSMLFSVGFRPARGVSPNTTHHSHGWLVFRRE